MKISNNISSLSANQTFAIQVQMLNMDDFRPQDTRITNASGSTEATTRITDDNGSTKSQSDLA